MMANPRIGQEVLIWYRASMRGLMILHGCGGYVVGVGRGRPRNHLVKIGLAYFVIPCGNLRKV